MITRERHHGLVSPESSVVNTLEFLVAQSRTLETVRKKDLHAGDCVLVTTKNSVYTVWALGNEEYWVWGGWFDLQGMSPKRITISGCTWGGSAILRNVVAACGLRMEFGNRVVTTQIVRVHIIRANTGPSSN